VSGRPEELEYARYVNVGRSYRDLLGVQHGNEHKNFTIFCIYSKKGELRKNGKKDTENVSRRLIRVLDSYIYVCVCLQQNKKRREPRGENVTLKL